MENKNRGKGYHVTIVDNNTGETIRDFDTRAINFVALNDSLKDTEQGKKIMEERNPLMGCGLQTSRLADGINLIQAFSIVDGLQGLLKDEFEEHPEFQLMARIFSSENIDLNDKELE